MLRVIVIVSFVTAAIIYTDWKNINKFYPTILFFIACNLIYATLYHNYPLWRFEPLPPIDKILFNNTIITMVLTFTAFPSSVLIFLSKYPEDWKQIPYLISWITLYSGIEFIMSKISGISYHNGWTFEWSVLFNSFLFPFLRIHSIKPMLAWCLSIAFLIFNFILFGFPVK